MDYFYKTAELSRVSLTEGAPLLLIPLHMGYAGNALPWSYTQFTSSWNQHCLWKSRLIFFSSTPLNKTLKLSLLHPTCLHLMCRNASFSQWESTCVRTKGSFSIQLKSTEFQNSNARAKDDTVSSAHAQYASIYGTFSTTLCIRNSICTQ